MRKHRYLKNDYQFFDALKTKDRIRVKFSFNSILPLKMEVVKRSRNNYEKQPCFGN